MAGDIISSMVKAAIFLSFAYYIGHFVRWLIVTVRRGEAKESMKLDIFIGSIVIVLVFLIPLSLCFGIEFFVR